MATLGIHKTLEIYHSLLHKERLVITRAIAGLEILEVQVKRWNMSPLHQLEMQQVLAI